MTVTVLIVEDSPTQAQSLASKLQEHQIEVLIAKDGNEGLRLAVEHTPDAIVLDVNMPKMDGYQVCRRLKRNAMTADIPVFMLTAADDPDNTMKGFEVGAEDFIPKDIYATSHLLENLRSLNLLPSQAADV
ncbi:MAG: response regulator [Chloroflexi bacterium]|nr:MAG: response regulator [Chloroflexota bacterium]